MSPLNDLNSIETSAVECSNEDKPPSSQSTSNYNVIETRIFNSLHLLLTKLFKNLPLNF